MGYTEAYEKCTFNRENYHNSRDGNNCHSKNDNNNNDNKNDVNNNGFEISIREIVTTIKITVNDVS